MSVAKHIDRTLANIDQQLGRETEVHLTDGEIVQGTLIEMSYGVNASPHVLFEEMHGDYRWLDVVEIESLHEAA